MNKSLPLRPLRLISRLGILFSLACTPLKLVAFTFQPGQLEASGEVGGLQLTTNSTGVQVTPIEVDTLQKGDKQFSGLTVGLGVGYFIPLYPNSNGINWLPYLKPMLKFRYVEQTIKGKVYQFQDPQFYNYDYRLSVKSPRLMFDLGLGLFTYDAVSGYIFGGLGETWNQLNYYDQPFSAPLGGSLSLNNKVNAKFISELGGGISYAMSQQVTLSLEYLYANLGTNRTSSYGTLNGAFTSITPIHFSIISQSVQFLVTWVI